MARSRRRMVLVLAVVLALAVPQVPALAQARSWNRSGAEPVRTSLTSVGVLPTGVDDDVPGVPLDSYPITSRIVVGTLDALPISLPPVDRLDVYSVYLAPGEQLTLGLTGPVGNFDLELLSPDTVSVYAPQYVVTSTGAGSTESICYTAADLFGAGRYYVVVRTDNAEGAYTLTWKVSGRSDGNFPGTLLERLSVAGTVNAVTDADDVYRLPLDVGQTLTVTVTADVSGDPIGLAVFPPVWDNAGTLVPSLDVWQTGDAVFGEGTAVTHHISVNEPGRAGDYYIDVYAPSGSTGYTLEWSVLPQLIPGTPLRDMGSPIQRVLSARSVYSIPLRNGDTFKGTIDAATGARVSARILKPGSLGPDGYQVAWANTTATDPKTFSYSVPANAEGTYYLELTPQVVGSVRLDWSVTRASTRLLGSSRYATAICAAEAAFPAGSDVVVVANGTNYPDALAAAGLAGAYDAPLLLTAPAALPSDVRAEIVRLGSTRCFIIGGTSAISVRAATALDAIPGLDVVRVAGADRYSTAAEVARRVVDRLGADYDGGVFVARGDTFPDALAVTPLAWRARRPVVLTAPTSLPDATAAVLDEIGADSAVVVGGTPAVSEAVRLQIAGIVGSATRVSGSDRYATAAQVARYGVNAGITKAGYIGVATGSNFPDALGGGVAAGAEGGVLLLTSPSVLSAPSASFIASYEASVRWCRVYGSTKAVSSAVMNSLNVALSAN
jgi:putative cell wall-binding protein